MPIEPSHDRAEWYLNVGGKTVGPKSLSEMLTIEKNHTELMVTKAGFTQWYPYKDIDSLIKESARHSTELQKDREQFMSHFESTLGSLKSRGTTPANPLSSKVEFRHPKRFPAPSILAIQDPAALWSGVHMIFRGELRLGKPLGFKQIIRLVLTLGISWGSWLSQRLHEVHWHLGSQDRVSTMRRLLRWIPPVGAYELSKLVIKMEAQNRYKETLALYAVALSLIPPIGAWYLQRKISRHWRLHLRKHLESFPA